MTDDEYVAELLAILQDPVHPAIHPYDRLGDEVAVEMLTRVPGRYGEELEVGVAVRRRAGDEPVRVVVRLPFDREWRELSGFTEPATYAPRFVMGLRPVLARALRTPDEAADRVRWREAARAALPSREVQRAFLVELLSSSGPVVEVGPDRFDVLRPDGSGVSLTAVVTPEEWEELLAENGMDSDVLWFDEVVSAGINDDERFVVVHEGRLERSTRAELPPVEGSAFPRRIAAARGDHPDGNVGWTGYARPEE